MDKSIVRVSIGAGVLVIATVTVLWMRPWAPGERATGQGGTESDGRSLAAGAVAAELPVDNPVRREEIARYLETLYAELDAAAKVLPRDTFDPAAVVKLAGRDSERLLTWVRDQTYWVPYQGTLRGPIGVLMDRLGNSLDRALLLAELERVAGRNVRLAHADLGDGLADTLLGRITAVPTDGSRAETVFNTPNRLPVAGDLRWIADAVRQSAEAGRQQTRRRYDEAVAHAGSQAEALMAAIGTAPIANGPDRRTAMRKHWWVQVEEAGTWVDLDPLAVGGPGVRLVAPTATVERDKDGRFRFDAGDRHELQIRVVIERWQDKRLSEQTVLERGVIPSEVIGEPIGLFHEGFAWKPDWLTGRSQDHAGAFRQAVIGQRNWVPILSVGTRRFKSSQAFSTDGEVGSSNAISALGRSGGGLLDAFGGGEAPGPAFLTAEWIEFEIKTPGRAPRTVRHEVFDLLGPAARSSGRAEPPSISDDEAFRRGGALLGETEILPLVSDVPSAWLYELTSRQLLATRDQWTRFARAEDPSKEPGLVRATGNATAMLQALCGYAVARRQISTVRGLVYQDSIGVVNLRWRAGLRQGEVTYGELIDLVANDVAVLPNQRQPSFQAAVHQGVADTVAERLMFGSESSLENTTSIFALATRLGVKPIAVRNGTDAAWRQIDAASDVRTRVDRDLTLGNLVVLPGRTLEQRLGWWRVNPVTGSTIGVMDRGFRQGDAEYVDTNVVARQHVVRPDKVNWMKGPRDVLRDLRVPEDHPQYMEMIGDVIELQEKMMKARKLGIFLE